MEKVKLKNEKPMTYEDIVRLRKELKAKIARLEAERDKNK